MKYIFKSRPFCPMKSNFWFLLPVVFTLLVAGCASSDNSKALDAQSSKYSADSLAKDWREQVRKNPRNPYENHSYPVDNDSDYVKPKKPVNVPSNRSGVPAYDSDEGYGRFPRYNPDDDNMPFDAKDYPLYMD